MFSQVQQALDCLRAALDGVEAAPTAELRQALEAAKTLRRRAELLETKTAGLIAGRERHGDSGAGLLHQVGGLTRSEAARNARTDAELTQIPAAQAGVAAGEISLANAARLAHAARKTSPDAVGGDPVLIDQAKTLPADEFAKTAQRWTIRRQSTEDLAAQHRRNRRNRNVRFWNGEDGTVQMRGSFDAEMGARIQQRLRRHAEQLRQADRRDTRNRTPGNDGNSSDGGSADGASGNGDFTGGAAEGAADSAAGGDAGVTQRTRDQRMADALDQLLAFATTVVAADQPATHSTDGATQQDAGGTAGHAELKLADAPLALPAPPAPPAPVALPAPPGRTGGAEVIVRADLDALVGNPDGIAEICGTGLIPPSALERLICNSNLSVVFFADQLTPVYETVASRAPNAAQRRALVARDGACIGCGTPPGECEAHHIIPVGCGGKTRVDNLVLVCWTCHDLIHDHNWQVGVRDGRFVLAPPGTALAPPGTAPPPGNALAPPGTALAPPGTALAPPGTALAPPGTAPPPGNALAPPGTALVPPRTELRLSATPNPHRSSSRMAGTPG